MKYFSINVLKNCGLWPISSLRKQCRGFNKHLNKKKKGNGDFPGRPDSSLSLQVARVWPLVRKLWFHMPEGREKQNRPDAASVLWIPLLQKLFLHLCITGHNVKENLLWYLGKLCEKQYPGGSRESRGAWVGRDADDHGDHLSHHTHPPFTCPLPAVLQAKIIF